MGTVHSALSHYLLRRQWPNSMHLQGTLLPFQNSCPIYEIHRFRTVYLVCYPLSTYSGIKDND
uniref:Uncharacterized protein n=1 Tax=Arundo donax TaxID=35708 RepID=A0A0A9KIZ9_ARUDO